MANLGCFNVAKTKLLLASFRPFVLRHFGTAPVRNTNVYGLLCILHGINSFWLLKMTTAQVVETSVTVNSSSIQNYVITRAIMPCSPYLWNDFWVQTVHRVWSNKNMFFKSFQVTFRNMWQSWDMWLLLGYFMYIETSWPRIKGDTAILQSKLYPRTTHGCCLQFYYHMYGQHMGTLKVIQSFLVGDDDTVLFEKSSDQGNQWFWPEFRLKLQRHHTGWVYSIQTLSIERGERKLTEYSLQV